VKGNELQSPELWQPAKKVDIVLHMQDGALHLMEEILP
jgi:hypothetical protein